MENKHPGFCTDKYSMYVSLCSSCQQRNSDVIQCIKVTIGVRISDVSFVNSNCEFLLENWLLKYIFTCHLIYKITLKVITLYQCSDILTESCALMN